MKKIAVFASGSGTNFQALVDEAEKGNLQADIRLLVCDKPGAKAVERAKKHGIDVFVFSAKSYETKEAFEEDILQALRQREIEFIALAGYMRLVGKTLLQAFEGRIVNIHPSLLPAFPGKDAIGQAYEAGVKITGVTIHYVDSGMDTGPVIAQRAVSVAEGETKETLTKKIQAVEHELYPQTLQQLFTK